MTHWLATVADETRQEYITEYTAKIEADKRKKIGVMLASAADTAGGIDAEMAKLDGIDFDQLDEYEAISVL